ncbi:MAG: hypothetical protein BWY79_00601 [Actinobacteria bacterium ADurb.Bin444]|nr:MAG: hypothetical protein BWY79_00601 [Actinobacteria bacterium ADurb.Bin444]
MIMGMSMRFTMKLGVSLQGTGVRPSFLVSSIVRSTTSELVCSAGMISTSLMTGTGLKKCIPTTRSGRPETAAS